MVFDTKALNSFSALAGVIGEYTSPSEFDTPSAVRLLTQEEENQACRLRKEFGWHAQHIAEAIGAASGASARAWQGRVLDAIVGCTTRGGWGGAEIDAKKPRPALEEGSLRDRRNLRGQAARDRLDEEEATLEGTNRFGEFRRSARTNAIIEAALRPEVRSFYGKGARKAGYQRTAIELAADANSIITQQKRDGHYPGLDYSKIGATYITTALKDLIDSGLFVWEGRVHSPGMSQLGEGEREKVDAEILRRLREQEELTPTESPYGFFVKVQKDVYSTFPCCGLDGKESMEAFGYTPIALQYTLNLSVANNLFGGPQGRLGTRSRVFADDPKNQQAVKDAIGDAALPIITEIMRKTGFKTKDVERILGKLGYATQKNRNDDIRAIILPLHDDQHLTVTEMYDETPALRKLYEWTTRLSAIQNISSLITHTPVLSGPRRVPWTQARKSAALGEAENQRRTPLVAERLRAGIVGFVHSMESQRSFGRLYLAVPSVQDLATGLNESESLITEAIQLLLAEPAPVIQMIDGVVQVPDYTQLQIQRGDVSRWEFSAN
jgi:hypothetical protein